MSLLGGDALEERSEATTLRTRDGEIVVRAGPFAHEAEQMAATSFSKPPTSIGSLSCAGCSLPMASTSGQFGTCPESAGEEVSKAEWVGCSP